MIHARDLVKRYGSFAAVDGLSFDVAPGEILGLIGPNGAGKTTTLKMLTGLLEPTEGEARIDGLPAEHPDARTRVGYLPEETAVYEDMTPMAYLRFFGQLYDVDPEEAEARITRILDDLDLDHRDRALGDMSKGMRRKVAIARSLVQAPDVLLYDEPASGLDPLATQTVLEFIESKRREGRAIIFSAHNLFHVERLCDRILILHQGEPVADGPVEDVLDEGGGRAYHVVLDTEIAGAVPRNGAYEVEVTTYREVEEVRERATAAGGRVLDVRTEGTTLEELFIHLTRGRT